MSLYQAVLTPNDAGPSHASNQAPNGVLNTTRRSRNHGAINGHPSSQVNGRERLSAPGRTVRNVTRRRHAHTLSTEREDINAATTLTAIMRGGSTPASTLSRTSSASSTGARVSAELSTQGGGERTPQPDDAQAAELMLFLATSPSPARPTATRSRQPPPHPPSSSGMPGLGLGVGPRATGRVLFPSSTDGDSRVQQLPTPEASQGTATSTPPPFDGSLRAGSFNLGDYINVSPSPGVAGYGGGGSAISGGMTMEGRRLFDEVDNSARQHDRYLGVRY